jgi:uncharacterized protein YaaN involved in tellurite resistance
MMSASTSLPAVANPGAIARIKSEIDIADRARIVTFGDRAQRNVVEFADRILAQTQNKEMGTTGELLSDVLGKARNLDPASLKDSGLLARFFSSLEARIRSFAERFQDVASQIDRITIELDRNKEQLRRDIALLDELHEKTKTAIGELDAHIEAGKEFAADVRSARLPALKEAADTATDSQGMLAAQSYQDMAQALDRLEKRVYYWSRRARSASSSCRRSAWCSRATRP